MMRNKVKMVIVFSVFVLILILLFSLKLYSDIIKNELRLREYANELYHKNQILNRYNINTYKILQEKYPVGNKFYYPKKFMEIENNMDSTDYDYQKSLADTLSEYYSRTGDDFDIFYSFSFFKSVVGDSVFLGDNYYPSRREKWIVLINGKTCPSLTINNYDASLSDSLVIELLKITANSEVSNFDTIKSRLVLNDL